MRGVALVLVVLLAGCLSPTAPTAQVSTVPTAPSALPVLANNSSTPAPVWRVGDAWLATSAPTGGQPESFAFVVTAADRDAYTLSTTSDSLATYDAIADVSYVGKTRVADLAGAQGDKPVQFFDFPLTDGKTWTTTWDGKSTTISAKFAPSIATASGQPGYEIVATQDGKPYATYDYVPALKWWSHIEFGPAYGLKIDRATTNWTGTISTAKAAKVFDSSTVFPVATINTQTFHVDERQSGLLLQWAGGAKSYARSWSLVDPNGTAYPSNGPGYDAQPQGGFFFDSQGFPAVPGDWKISAPVAHSNDGGFLLTVHEVALTKRAFP